MYRTTFSALSAPQTKTNTTTTLPHERTLHRVKGSQHPPGQTVNQTLTRVRVMSREVKESEPLRKERPSSNIQRTMGQIVKTTLTQALRPGRGNEPLTRHKEATSERAQRQKRTQDYRLLDDP